MGQFEPGLPDPLPFVLVAGPHEDVESGRPQGPAHVDDPAVAADQQGARAGGADDAEPAGHGGGGQRVEQDRSDDHQEGDREDLRGAGQALVGEVGGEGGGRGGRDDPARGHPADEPPLPEGQPRLPGGDEGDERPYDQDQERDEEERGEQYGLQGRRCHGRRDRDEQQSDDQLDQCLEEGPAGGHVEAGEVGDCQPGDDRGDQPGVVADDVAPRRHDDHHGQLGDRAERLAEPQDAQRQPQQGDAHGAADQADAHADRELSQLVAPAQVGLRGGDRVEDERAEDAADRVDQRPLPDEDAPQLVGGPHVFEERPHHRGARHHEDHAHHGSAGQ